MKENRFQQKLDDHFDRHTGKTKAQREIEYKVKRDAQKKLATFNFAMRIFGLVNTCLLFLFIVLRACDVINWKWYWIISPFWIPLFLGLAMVFIFKLIFK